jgi:peroxiredoxin
MAKRIFVILLSAVVILSVFSGIAFTSGKIPVKGEPFPEIRLPVPADPDEKSYLGISGSSLFRISQIKASVVIIEIFSLYCPQCQAFSPEANILYYMIEQVPEFKERIKLIGIGAGNSPFEVETFKKTHDVPFPLFPDRDFAIHKLLGEVRTPHFIVIRIHPDRTRQVIYSEPGAFGEAGDFLQRILKDSGLR